MKLKLLVSALALLGVSIMAAAQDTNAQVDSYIESLRADLRADKVAIITNTMKFTDQEAKIFWPVYRRYEADTTKVNDIRVNALKMYADKYMAMTDSDAKALIAQSLDYQTQRATLRKKYAKEFQKAGLSALTTAKFLQLEYRLDLLADVNIAAAYDPLVKK